MTVSVSLNLLMASALLCQLSTLHTLARLFVNAQRNHISTLLVANNRNPNPNWLEQEGILGACIAATPGGLAGSLSQGSDEITKTGSPPLGSALLSSGG